MKYLFISILLVIAIICLAILIKSAIIDKDLKGSREGLKESKQLLEDLEKGDRSGLIIDNQKLLISRWRRILTQCCANYCILVLYIILCLFGIYMIFVEL